MFEGAHRIRKELRLSLEYRVSGPDALSDHVRLHGPRISAPLLLAMTHHLDVRLVEQLAVYHVVLHVQVFDAARRRLLVIKRRARVTLDIVESEERLSMHLLCLMIRRLLATVHA